MLRWQIDARVAITADIDMVSRNLLWLNSTQPTLLGKQSKSAETHRGNDR